ncbi:MAG: ABC transporter ATP-binding protein [Geobacteraceae bacterium]|jgi:NitT/TauT family transport system ATP-binding protein
MIEVKGISKIFQTDNGRDQLLALDSVSLTIGAGAFVSLVGPTGCGKSTFLEILAGLQTPTIGEVCIEGKQVLEPVPDDGGAGERPRRKYNFLPPFANSLFRDHQRHDVAMIFQDYTVFPWMTARQNILFTLKVRGVPKTEREDMVCHYLSLVDLEGAAHNYPSRMSGGMRQRLALARALAVEPKIILMDEPFAAVDALTREKLQDDLLKIRGVAGTTVVLVTHDLREAAYLSDEIVVFSPSPGTILRQVPVRIPRPRLRVSDELNAVREEVLSIFKNN